MAQRRLLLQLCVLVEDLDDDTRAELARDLLLNDLDEPEEVPVLADHHAEEIGNVIADYFGPENCSEMLAGSEIYIQFHSAQMLGAEWNGDAFTSSDDPVNLAGSGPVPIEPREG
ncbi:MAG: hypothetical protein M9905_17660 [Rhizobiaceae bacterium]|nr:hypothetical protein [Rhizobiaceae bacterium]